MKERLDTILVKQGYYESGEKARANIMAGNVLVDGELCTKAGTKFNEDIKIEIKEEACPYVSRGGLKLDKALDDFQVDPEGLVVMDIGASTGGFTHCLLERGAKRVYAIDVGYGQLHYKLRNDPRIVNLERTNIRYLTEDQVPEKVDLITIDVSFISLKLVFPTGTDWLKPGGRVISLVKPQFEAGRDKVGKGGIVKDDATRQEVIENVKAYGLENGLKPLGVIESPIKGAKGNVEYLMLLEKQ